MNDGLKILGIGGLVLVVGVPFMKSGVEGVESLAGPKKRTETEMTEGAPQDHWHYRDGLASATGPVAATSDAMPDFMTSTIAGWREATRHDVVAKLRLLPEVERCTPTPPAENAQVAAFYTLGGGADVRLWTYSKKQVADVAEQWIKSIQGYNPDDGRFGMPPSGVPRPVASYQYQVLDVAVTEVGHPVHVVLEQLAYKNAPTQKIYNFHLAEGVEISGVTIVGGAVGGVANLSETVRVEHVTDENLADCGLVQRHYRRVETFERDITRENRTLYGNDARRLREEIAPDVSAFRRDAVEYAGWFKQSFGVDHFANVRGMDFARGLRIGPALAEGKAPVYRHFAGAVVTLSAKDYLRFKGGHEWPEAFQDDVLTLATEVAGGDPRTVFGAGKFAAQGF